MSKRADHAMRDYGTFNPLVNSNPTEDRQTAIYNEYARILTELAVNRYKWSGMPDSVNLRFLELSLFRSGLSVFFYNTDVNSFMSLRGTPTGQQNYVEEFTAFTVTGNLMTPKRLSAVPRWLTSGGEKVRIGADCVPIYANAMRMPDINIVRLWAHKLAVIDRTIEINSTNARITRIMAVGENQRMTAANVQRQLEEGQLVIPVHTDFNVESYINSFDMGINPDHIINLHILRTRIWSDVMGLLGINNGNQDKKERLVEAEVAANDEQVQSLKWTSLNSRKTAAEAINRRWGLDVDVEFNTDVQAMAAAMLPAAPDAETEGV